MGFTTEQLTQLQSPLSTTLVKQRKGGGDKKLSYIKGKTAIDIANQIFGFGRWGYEVVTREFVQHRDGAGNVTAEFYTADVIVQIADSPFTFPGDGVGIVGANGPRAQEHEKARKEAVTDALKRALRHFGPQFGNDLYDEDAVVTDEQGNDVRVGNIGRAPQRPAPPTQQQTRPAAPTTAPQPIDANARISEAQVRSIRKLCEALDKNEPGGLTTMTNQEGREQIQQLTAEYRQRNTRAS